MGLYPSLNLSSNLSSPSAVPSLPRTHSLSLFSSFALSVHNMLLLLICLSSWCCVTKTKTANNKSVLMGAFVPYGHPSGSE